jgi:hypothetical protein
MPLLITTQQRIIIIKPNITMRAGSMKMPSTTRLRLKSTANKLTNIRAVRTLILKNRVFGKWREPCRLRSNPGPYFLRSPHDGNHANRRATNTWHHHGQ